MISTHWKEIHQPSERELRIFDVLARQAADLIERINTEANIRRSNERYQMLFNSIDEGFCVCEMLYNDSGEAVDYRFLEVNPAYIKLTGLYNAVGRTGRELVPNLEEKWFEIYARVLETGKAIRFESHLEAWNKWYDLYVTPAGKSSEHKFAILFSDITDRKKYENALIDSDRRKDEFLATLSHELRNPLTPIKGALEMMETGVDHDTDLKFRDIMKRQVNKMAHLIDDLMDISRINRGKIRLQKKAIDLAVAVKEVTEAVDSTMAAENHNFKVELPETPVYIHADLNRIVQILTNLLSNSARYTDPGGEIKLKVTREAGNVKISVKDNGIGLSPEHLESIFDMFSQVKSSNRRQHSGLGIGLSLVKNLVEMHDGTVKAFSEGENKGSTFVISFPMLDGSNPEANKVPDQKEEQEKITIRKLKIVVLDDNKDIADMIRSGLKHEGHDVIACYNGGEALECIDGFNPEAAVLDIGLPDYDGYELANIVRKRFPGIFLVAHSGWGQEKDKIKALEAGFNRHLVKPAGLKDILAVLNELKD
jgi:signal transduction histidine kinase/CheY-like chemotaxis protein